MVGLLSRRYSIEKGRWVSSLLLHVTASAVLASLYPLLYILLSSTPGVTSRLKLLFFINAQVFGMVIYWVILSIILTLNYYRRFQDERLSAARLEAQLKDAKLQALRMQLHPHFLFNALHSVTALVLKNENREAVRMISRLSELLRYAFKDNDIQWITLEQELQFLEQYLEIERIRFQDRLTVVMNIEPQTLTAEVPNLILQPLVENAVRHGISKHSSAGTITLSAMRLKEELHLEVVDDAYGLPADWSTVSSNGVGIKNTRARLEQLYAGRYEFDISNITDRGTVAALKLPFRKLRKPALEGESKN